MREEINPNYTIGDPHSWITFFRTETTESISSLRKFYAVICESPFDQNSNHSPQYLGSNTTKQLLAWAEIAFPLQQVEDPIWVNIFVDPPARRRGIGTQIINYLEALPTPLPTKQITGESYLPLQADESHEYIRWAKSQGWKIAGWENAQKITWPINKDLLDALARPIPSQYQILCFKNGVPSPIQTSLGKIRGLLDYEAPTGEIKFSNAAISPEEYCNILNELQKDKTDLYEAVVIYKQTVVGYSAIAAPADLHRSIRTDGTLIIQKHRGNGLGLATKIALYRFSLTHNLPHKQIITENANENPWMIKINNLLGFKTYQRLVEFVKNR